MPPFLVVREVAAILRSNEWTVREWARQGKIPATRIGRRLLIPRDGLAELLKPAAPKAHATA